MGKPIAQAIVDDIRRSVDIVDLVSRYFPLKKAGKNLKALCPFHKEKSPSFVVNAERQTFHCFGCGEKGDAFTFVQRMERLASFPEAIEFLGRVAGIEVRREDDLGEGSSGAQSRAEMFRLLEAAASYYRKVLLRSEGAAARAYLRGRGITEESEEAFRLGYAAPSFHALRDAAAARGIAPDLLLATGLAIQGDDPSRPPYDRFRNRLIFPIADGQSRVIGFGGRVLDGSEPKYLNSPETSLFSKGRGLYGLDVARGAILDSKEVVVVEGYTDVILAHQAGIRNVVATLGTALTIEHARCLRRYAAKVVVLYDGDPAGAAATGRGVKVLLSEPLDIHIVRLPAGLDPADAVLEKGAGGFTEILAEARDFFECVMDDLRAKLDFKTVSGRSAAAEKLLDIAKEAADPVRRDILVRRISDEIGVSEDALRARLRDGGARSGSRASAGSESADFRPQTALRSASERAETEILEALFNAPSAAKVVLETLREEDFEDSARREIFRAASEVAHECGAPRRESILARLSPEAAEIAQRLSTAEREAAFYERLAEGHLGFFERRRNERDFSALRGALKATPATSEDEASLRRILRELYEVRLRGTIRPGSPRSPGG